jgi:membrane protease YdiL (CAAX protease family)
MISPDAGQPRFPPAVTKIRAFCFGAIALAYFYVAQNVAERAADGLSSADWVDLVYRLMLLFLLFIGYSLMGRVFQKQAHPLYDMGFKLRPGWQREWGTGAAIGWGALTIAILPVVLTGGLVVTLWGAPHQWFLLVVDIFVLLAASLAEELVFRGYALQRFIESVGTSWAVFLIAGFAAMMQFSDPFAPRTSAWVAFLLGWLLSLGYLRTRALWLPWGLRFAWYAATSLIFGLPIGGISRYTPIVQSTTHGADWLTGSDYGPEAGVFTVLVLAVALFVLVRLTRDYAYRYATPEIIPAGIPVDIDAITKRQHEVGMGPVIEPAAPKLVQIGGIVSEPELRDGSMLPPAEHEE